MTLTRSQQQDAKKALLDYAWNLYEYPDVDSDLSHEQRLYVRKLIFRMAKTFGIQEF